MKRIPRRGWEEESPTRERYRPRTDDEQTEPIDIPTRRIRILRNAPDGLCDEPTERNLGEDPT